MKNSIFILTSCVVLLASALAEPPSTPADREKALLAERNRKDVEFRNGATSPMAAVERRTLSPGEAVWLVAAPPGIVQAEANPTEAVFRLGAIDGRWEWSALKTPRPRGAAASSGELTAGMEFPLGSQTVAAYPTRDALTLIRFDPNRPERAKFKGLKYFSFRPAFAVEARWVRFPNPEKVTLRTSRSLQKEFYRFGEIRFFWKGKAERLTAFVSSLDNPAAEGLFVPFRDASAGRETYAAGRFLDVPCPSGEQFILDFNTAYNPLCNYADTYNCPRPPDENTLDFPVLAGEKTYGEGKH